MPDETENTSAESQQEGYAVVTISGEGAGRKVDVKFTEESAIGLALMDANEVLGNAVTDYPTYVEELEGGKTYWTKLKERYELDPWRLCYETLNRSPLLRRGLRRKAEFAATGFNVWSKNKRQSELCNKLAGALNLDAFETQHHYHLQVVDMALPWWQYFEPREPRPAYFPTEAEAPKCPKWLEFIHPKMAQPAGGSRRIKLRPWLDGRYLGRGAQEAKTSLAPDTKLAACLKKAAQKREPILLDEILSQFNLGYRPSFSWTKFDWEDWPRPSSLDILPDIEYLLICAQVDANTIAQTKAGVIRFGIGPEGNAINMKEGQNPPPTKQEVTALVNLIKEQIQNRNPMYIGRNDLKIEWIVPPAALFSLEKYQAAQGRVMDWLDLPATFWPVGFLGAGGRGEAYASAYISVKPLRAHIEAQRRTTRRWLERFLWEISVANRWGDDKIEVHHDNTVLLEDRQVLDNVTALGRDGGMSQSTMLDAFGYDAEYEAERQREEKTLHEAGIFLPRAPAQTPGGRPQTSDEVVRPTDQPKPSQNTEDEDKEYLELWPSIEAAMEEVDI